MTSFPPLRNVKKIHVNVKRRDDVMTALGIRCMKVTFTAYRQGRTSTDDDGGAGRGTVYADTA